MARKADFTVDPAAEIEADVVSRDANCASLGRCKFTNVKFASHMNFCWLLHCT
jgi:hypothetical protein